MSPCFCPISLSVMNLCLLNNTSSLGGRDFQTVCRAQVTKLGSRSRSHTMYTGSHMFLHTKQLSSFKMCWDYPFHFVTKFLQRMSFGIFKSITPAYTLLCPTYFMSTLEMVRVSRLVEFHQHVPGSC